MLDTETEFADISTKIERDAQGRLVAVRTQDTTPYLEANRRAFNEAPSWRPYSDANGMREVADIPMIVVEQWMKEGVNLFDPSPEMQKKVAQKLNSNEFQYLRTYPGRVGYAT
jgi:hypothetical protein